MNLQTIKVYWKTRQELGAYMYIIGWQAGIIHLLVRNFNIVIPWVNKIVSSSVLKAPDSGLILMIV